MIGSSRASTPMSPDSSVPGQKTRQAWTPEEDRLLSEAVARETPKNGPVSWHKVASHLPGRNNKDCRKRWHYSIANTIRKGTWMREEDDKLREAVELYGARWSKIAEAVGTRNGDQCWKRWYDCLDPRIDKSPWSAEDDAKLLHLVSHHGRNWSDIVHQHFPNRTSLAAKNRYSILRRKQEGSSSSSRASSVRRAKSKLNSPATSTPSSASSPYLSVPTPPLYGAGSSAETTPEPEAEIPAEGWMALTEAEIDELLYQACHMPVDDGWYPDVSGTPSPQIGGGVDADFGAGEWVGASTGDVTGQVWIHAQTGFESDSQMQMASTGGSDGYYAHGQQAEAAGYGYNALGVYPDGFPVQGSSQGMYDAGGELTSQGGMAQGSWMSGYSMGSW